jgi:2-polyprenyl-3-methyl-5-hydroxy-6-metoxy-1,4-benzoquinol methylase
MKKITVNELPQYSRWISELLNYKSEKKIKNEQQVQREYGLEKWGSFLKKWYEKPCDIEEVNKWSLSQDHLVPAWCEQGLTLMTPKEAHERYIQLLLREMRGAKSGDLVEIGCGYGAILLRLILDRGLSYKNFIGLEYTNQGIELATQLARWHGIKVEIGHGDFNGTTLTGVKIRPKSDILTSYSFSFSKNSEYTLRMILNLNPRTVFHFEPIFQHLKQDTTLGLLQRKYMQLNDYNTTHYDALQKLQSEGRIKIIKEEPLAFGPNCLLPASIIVWQPS